MGLIAKVIDSSANNGEPAAKVEIYKNDNANARIFNPSGVDARPIDGDFCFTEDSGDTEGGKDVLGFIDPNNASVSDKGEYRAYSRNSAGIIQADLHLKKDGLTELKNNVTALSSLISDLFAELRTMTTVGSATSQAIDPATQVRLTILENKFKLLIG